MKENPIEFRLGGRGLSRLGLARALVRHCSREYASRRELRSRASSKIENQTMCNQYKEDFGSVGWMG